MSKCVVVGNGISLTPDQLDLVDRAGMPSIACNRINLIYKETAWRPTIYVRPESLAQDVSYIQENIDLGITCYIGEHYQKDIKNAENVKFIKDCHHHLLNFSDPEVLDEWHLPQLCSFGGSVNVAMQVAVLNGFDEIILLGCDLLYRDKKPSHFHKDYEHGGEQPAFYAARNAFYGHVQALNWIRRKRQKIRVLNATPGGLLELWERVNLRDVIYA